MFKTGQKVICINASFGLDPKTHQFHLHWIRENAFYHIRKCEMFEGKTRVLLEEIVNPKVFDHIKEVSYEPGFNGERFRAIEDSPLEEILKEVHDGSLQTV